MNDLKGKKSRCVSDFLGTCRSQIQSLMLRGAIPFLYSFGVDMTSALELSDGRRTEGRHPEMLQLFGPLLAGHFLKELEKRHGQAKESTPGFLRRLEGFRFGGNVRELHNVVEQAYYLLGPEKRLRAVDISIPIPDLSAEKEKINSRSQRLFKALIRGEADFEADIRERFLARDLSRLEVRGLHLAGAGCDGRRLPAARKKVPAAGKQLPALPRLSLTPQM